MPPWLECNRISGTWSVIDGGPRPCRGPPGYKGALPGVASNWAWAGSESGMASRAAIAAIRLRIVPCRFSRIDALYQRSGRSSTASDRTTVRIEGRCGASLAL
jgi:hypothetical protein